MIFVIGAQGYIENVESFIRQVLLFSKKENLVIQAFDATAIYSTDHLISATEHAKRAFEQDSNATNSLALEILLYASGERQIEKALKKMGVKKGKQKIVFLVTDVSKISNTAGIGEEFKKRLLEKFHLRSDDAVIQGDRMTLKHLGITQKELSTIPESQYGDLVLEKIALVDIIKK